ncbi:MAG: bifunctional transaldolase/phosoglucose isomerase [Coxiellaceae bacterium]|nr:bifunctional transaldolase/phosoglucose isomerase [Coxiellaceae bacterium]
MNKNHTKFSAGNLTDQIEVELISWEKDNKTQRLWARDATLWTNQDENKWMGWLTVSEENNDLTRINLLVNEIKTLGFTDIVLLGMGGSSLCPAMMAETFGKIGDYPQLHILDSTDPLQIKHLKEKIDLKKTFFIVSSKSGSTLEPTIFEAYFYARLQETVNNKAELGNHFIAITDPNTPLETLSRKEHFKAVFHGVPSIGGRYSALSNFGIVPAAFMGIDVKTFLDNVNPMKQACAVDTAKNNPGVMLGVILGVCGNQGKNKVTLIASPEIHSLGAWLEQLLAESTGKQGKGLIPVDQEPLGDIAVYSDDRVFVYIRLNSKPDAAQDHAVDQLEQAGFVVVRLNLENKMHLGAELFRWEIATAVAGSVLGINPFNQPDVEDSKIITAKLTDEFEKTGKLIQQKAFFSDGDISLFTDEKNQKALSQQCNKPSLLNYLYAHLNRVVPGDYVNLSAFIEMSDKHTTVLQDIRTLIRDHKKVATCLGFGPRFLHSTGQAYKGGPNTGVFLQITADHLDDIAVPGHHYTFGLVIAAEAQGDFTVLAQRDRRVLRIHLGKDVDSGLKKLKALME